MRNLIKSILNTVGYDIRNLRYLSNDEKKVDAFSDQKRILQNNNIEVKTILDIGAYDGALSKEYRRLFPSANLYSFEPFPHSYDKLLESVKQDKCIQTFNLAVTDSVGSVFLYCKSSDAANSILPSEVTHSYIDQLTKEKERIEVASVTIDHFVEQQDILQIDILKLDIQGGEMRALKGGEKMLKQQKIHLVYTEVEFMRIYRDQPLFHNVVTYLQSCGYELWNLYNLMNDEYGRLAWGDALFIPKTHIPLKENI